MNRYLPMIVSHYTVDTGYEKEVKNLVASLERWNLEYDVTSIPSLGSWRANSNHCSVVVRDALARYSDRDVLRVDADAVFQKFPELFLDEAFTADVAAHIANFPWHRRELLGGTIFFRNCPAVRSLVDDWVELCTVERPKERNGDLLQSMMDSGRYGVSFQELPATYCKIFDIMRDVSNPVIEHFQASRRFRRPVDMRGKQR